MLLIESDITDVGDVPYELIRPILIRVESPEQLVSCHKTDLSCAFLTDLLGTARVELSPVTRRRCGNMERAHQKRHTKLGQEAT